MSGNSRAKWSSVCKTIVVGIVLALSSVMLLRPALAGYAFHIEGVNVYTGGTGNTLGAVDALGFESAMTGFGWVTWAPWTDGNVYDTDFFDPDVTGSTNIYDSDYAAFDPEAATISGNTIVISYYAGHGHSQGSKTDVGCTHSSECTSPGANYSLPGICTTCPQGGGDTGCQPDPTKPGVCRYVPTNPYNGAYLNGSSVHHGNVVDWASPTAGTAWGESDATGGWFTLGGKNAKENGGVNMVVLHQSFGGVPGLWQNQTQSIFAGMHLLGLTSPTDGDTTVVANRGSAFAADYGTMQTSSIGDAFISTGDALTGGTGCPSGTGPRTGYGGYNGCGCTTVISWDQTYMAVAYHTTSENWTGGGIQDDGNDAAGSGLYEWYTDCNYDLASYPFSN